MQMNNGRVYPFVKRAARSRDLSGLSGNGWLGTAARVAAAYYTGGASEAASAAAGGVSSGGGDGGGGGGPAAGGITTVSPTISPAIQTTISPQISPVFQQSYMPQNSGMTAGTTQTAPSVQSASTTGSGFPPGTSAPSNMPSIPGYDPTTGQPYPATIPGYDPTTGQPYPAHLTASQQMIKYLTWAMGAVAVVAIVMVLKNRSSGRKLKRIDYAS